VIERQVVDSTLEGISVLQDGYNMALYVEGVGEETSHSEKEN
jgi:hypothetical protein